MKWNWLFWPCCAALLLSSPAVSQGKEVAASPATAGFHSLFNGKDLTGWEGLDGFWTVKDGVIVGAETKAHPAPQTFLICKQKFGDFELHFQYKFATPAGNSGVQFRSKIINAKQHRVGGYQADFDAGRGYDGTIYDEAGVAGGRGTMSNRGEKTVWDAQTKRHAKRFADGGALQKFIKAGDWNDAVLVADGNHVTYKINGHLMTDLTDNSPKALTKGVLALQLHAGFVMQIEFKGLEIKELHAAHGASK